MYISYNYVIIIRTEQVSAWARTAGRSSRSRCQWGCGSSVEPCSTRRSIWSAASTTTRRTIRRMPSQRIELSCASIRRQTRGSMMWSLTMARERFTVLRSAPRPSRGTQVSTCSPTCHSVVAAADQPRSLCSHAHGPLLHSTQRQSLGDVRQSHWAEWPRTEWPRGCGADVDVHARCKCVGARTRLPDRPSVGRYNLNHSR